MFQNFNRFFLIQKFTNFSLSIYMFYKKSTKISLLVCLVDRLKTLTDFGRRKLSEEHDTID